MLDGLLDQSYDETSTYTSTEEEATVYPVVKANIGVKILFQYLQIIKS